MKDISVVDTRTFAIVGHTGSGKTTLVDALLFKLGINDRMGLIANGSSAADYTNEEKNRRISIFAKPFCGAFKTAAGKNVNVVFVDTPGYLDFVGQVISATHAVETALVAVDAVAGVQVGTRRAWKTAQQRGLARAIVITGLDRENADFRKVLESLQANFGAKCIPVVLPQPGGGVLDVLGNQSDVPAEVAEQVSALKAQLTEIAAETDDTLIEKFLGGEELSPAEQMSGLRKAVAHGNLIPVFACGVLKDMMGVAELLEGVARLFPSPCDKPPRDIEGRTIGTDPNDPFVGFVWRTVNDPFVGQLTFLRVLGGMLKSDSEVWNAVKGQKERIGTVLLLNGRKQESIPAATAGDIVALPKLKVTGVCDTLCSIGQNTRCAPIQFPKPVMFQAVRAKSQADEDKLGVALSRLCDEDPTLHVERNRETKETVLQGLGDVHLDVAAELMRNRSNVDVLLSTPKVPYRETVTARGEGHYKHKKQTGGRGQYGEVYLRVEPNPQGNDEWFVDAVVGGVIPGNFMPAVQKGLLDAMQSGTLAGYPVTDVKVTVYDGSYHEVDSSEISFKIAAARAFKEGMKNAKPVLLEPIMRVKIMVPEQFMGDVNGDLNHRRGRILGMENEEGVQVILAEVPQAELFRYAAELRSMTGGQGTFEMEFCRYEQVPTHVAQKVIAAAAKEKEEEEE